MPPANDHPTGKNNPISPAAPVPPAMEVSTSAVKVQTTRTDAFLKDILEAHPAYFQKIIENKDEFRLQIIYSRIDRDAKNQPTFTDYHYNVSPDLYFYPASTVKMPVALLALQRLRELNVPGLNKESTMLTGAAYSGQNEVYNDPTTIDGRPSVGHYVKKIFLVSDNDAYNRLYEFLGQEYINTQLQKMGFKNTEIIHRLERVLNEDQNRHTNPIRFLGEEGKGIYDQPMAFNTKPYQDRNDHLGRAYMKGGNLIQGPMDFSKKNRFVLEDLHGVVRSILFPESVSAEKRFKITEEDKRFVWQYMSQFPGETAYPSYSQPDYWDAYCKFLYWGSEKQPLPKTFRIFNKVGDAYGFLIDAAYITDQENGIEFMLSAVIYCNSDGVLNDSKYDYDSVGFPFMKHLGQVIYAYEKERKRTFKPDLSTFRMSYEK